MFANLETLDRSLYTKNPTKDSKASKSNLISLM